MHLQGFRFLGGLGGITFSILGEHFERGGEFMLEKAALFQQFFGADVEFVGMERFFKIGICAHLESLQAVFVRGACRHHNYRDMIQQFGSANLAGHLESIHFRHHYVGYDDVRHQFLCLCKAFLAVGGEVIVERRIHLTCNVFSHILSVFNNQHTRVVRFGVSSGVNGVDQRVGVLEFRLRQMVSLHIERALYRFG